MNDLTSSVVNVLRKPTSHSTECGKYETASLIEFGEDFAGKISPFWPIMRQWPCANGRYDVPEKYPAFRPCGEVPRSRSRMVQIILVLLQDVLERRRVFFNCRRNGKSLSCSQYSRSVRVLAQKNSTHIFKINSFKRSEKVSLLRVNWIRPLIEVIEFLLHYLPFTRLPII